MRCLALAMAFLAVATIARAQDAAPDLKGTWVSKAKSVVYGNNPHHPGSETTKSPPRLGELDYTIVIDGQEGRLAWGHGLSSVAVTNEPVAWAISVNNKTVMGADTDGYYHITLMSVDRMEMCYTQNSLGPSGAIVVSCSIYDRVKK